MGKLRIHCFFIFIFIGFSISVTSQEINYLKIDRTSGLPSNEVFDIIQDKDHNIWFATSKGIAVYNSYSFKIYDKSSGLPAYSVIKLYEDRHGRIWFSQFTGEFGYISDGIIKEFPYKFFYKNKKTIVYHNGESNTETKGQLVDFIQQFYLDKYDNLWLSLNYSKIVYVINNKGELQKKDISLQKGFQFENTVKEFEDGYIFQLENFHNNPIRVNIITPNDTLSEDVYHSHLRSYNSASYVIIKKYNKRVFLVTSILVCVDEKGNIKYRDLEEFGVFNNLETDDIGNLWVCSSTSGLLKFEKGDILNEPIQYFPNSSVTNILFDFEGNYWIALNNNGVMVLSDFQAYKYLQFTGENSVMSVLCSDKSFLYILINNEIVKVKVNEQKIENHTLISLNDNTLIENFIVDDAGNILVTKGKNFYVNQNGSPIHNTFVKRRPNDFAIIGADTVLMALRDGYAYYSRKENTITRIENSLGILVESIYRDHDKWIWLGTNEGLWKFKGEQKIWMGNQNPFFKNRIADIAGNEYMTVISSHSDGVAIENAFKTIFLTKSDGLSSNYCNQVLLDNNKIFVATDHGITYISSNNQTGDIEFIRTITTKDGLLSDIVNGMAMIDSVLWITTSKGLCSLLPQNVKPENHIPYLTIDNILVNGKKKNIQNTFLKYNENTIKFSFRAVLFRHHDLLQYNYKLVGQDDDWQSSDVREARYTNLSPGKYHFLVKVNAPNNITVEKGIEFEIKKHYTQTTVFLIIIILLSLLIFWLTIKIIIKLVRRRLEFRQQIILSEQKALKAQMNPHFIFNSLNSIQDYIIDTDSDNAQEYLLKFSALIRSNLNFSNAESIPLEEEIKLLKIYLDLEKLRFGPAFNWSLDVDPKIITSGFNLPPMLIQPLLENAIWHGLLPKEGDRTLMIKITPQADENLNIMIEDNGIGRKAAMKVKRKGHESLGLKNIIDRITLLSNFYSLQMNLNIDDLTDKEGNPKGTRVTLSLHNFLASK